MKSKGSLKKEVDEVATLKLPYNFEPRWYQENLLCHLDYYGKKRAAVVWP
jgi:hypothetical protein